MIGIAPCGLITFISKAYGGRITDSQLTVDCGVIDKLESEDEVMLDKGFPGVSINFNTSLFKRSLKHSYRFTYFVQTFLTDLTSNLRLRRMWSEKEDL